MNLRSDQSEMLQLQRTGAFPIQSRLAGRTTRADCNSKHGMIAYQDHRILIPLESERMLYPQNGRGPMKEHDRDIGWFLAQIKPNSHKIAERNLARQGFQTFLPMQEETRRISGRFTTLMRPLFPGYLFVALDILQGSWRKVNSTYGITRLVGLANEPTPVPCQLVSQLMLRCDHAGKLLPPSLLKTGDAVTVTKGPFTNFVATIESVTPDRRVWLLMELMGAQTRVAVDAAHVQVV